MDIWIYGSNKTLNSELKALAPHIMQMKHETDHSLPYSAKLKKWNPHVAFSFMVLINTPLHARMSFHMHAHHKHKQI